MRCGSPSLGEQQASDVELSATSPDLAKRWGRRVRLYTAISCHGNPTPELIVTLNRGAIACLIVERWEPRNGFVTRVAS